jgi:hypothetical protein
MKSDGFAMNFRGGAHYKPNRNFSARSIYFDRNPIRRGDPDFGNGFGTGDAVLQNNRPLTFGGAFHF